MLPTDSSDTVVFKIALRAATSVSGPAEQFTTWTITGVAAALTFAVTNLNGLTTVVNVRDLKIGLVALVVSLLFGVISKQLGQGTAVGLANIERIETLFSQPEFLARISPSALSGEELANRIADAFLWPLSSLMRRSSKRASGDPLHGDKLLALLLSLQLVTNLIHVIAALFGATWIVLHV